MSIMTESIGFNQHSTHSDGRNYGAILQKVDEAAS